MRENNQKITIHIMGTAMDSEKGYELSYLIKSLQKFEKISQKTYLYLTSQNRMTEKANDDFKLYINDIRPGSFKADIVVFCQNYILPLVPIVTEHRDIIWECVLKSFEFLKSIAKAKKEGKTVQIENQGNNVIVNTGDGVTIDQFVYPNFIPELAERLAKPFSEMAGIVDGDVEGVAFESKTGDIILDIESSKYFKKHTYLTEKSFEIIGEMTVINSNNYKGKIKISDSEDFKDDEYSFELSNDLKYSEFLQSGFLREAKYRCSKKVIFDPTDPLGEKIVAVRILEKI